MIANACSVYTHAVAIAWAVTIGMFVFPPDVGAQGSRVAAALEGTVRDSSGAAISGAAVVVRNVSTNQARDTETNEEGIFPRGGAIGWLL